MKRLSIFFVISLLVLASSNLYAERASGLYLGVKTALIEPDDFNGLEVDDDTTLGAVLGYDLGGIAIQGEYYTANNAVVGSVFDLETDVLGVYGVYRSDGLIYFMGKAGMVSGESEAGGFSNDDTSLSYGLGVGVSLGDTFQAEAEYLIYEIEEVEVDLYGVTAYIKF